MGVRLVGREPARLVPAAPASVTLAVVVGAVGLRAAVFVPLPKQPLADAGFVHDLAREAASLVPEQPRAHAKPIAIVVTEDARLAAAVPDGEGRQLLLPDRARERGIGGGELDDERVGGREDVDGRLVGASRGKLDLLLDERAVLPAIPPPGRPFARIVEPLAEARAVDVGALDHLGAALVVTHLEALAHAVVAAAPLGLGAAAEDAALRSRARGARELNLRARP